MPFRWNRILAFIEASMFPCVLITELCNKFSQVYFFNQGTRQFMSRRLVELRFHDTQGIIHTAIDDMESFFWILYWAVLAILHQKHHSLGIVVSANWKNWLQPYSPLEKGLVARIGLANYLKSRDRRGPPEWQTWRPFLSAPWDTCQEASSDLEQLLENQTTNISQAVLTLSDSAATKFAEILVDHLYNSCLPTIW